jgi:hypothetical protein
MIREWWRKKAKKVSRGPKGQVFGSPLRHSKPRSLFFRPYLEHLEVRETPTVFTVMNTNDMGAGSLREKLGLAGNGDTIKFDIADGLQVISPATALPTISHNITIDGSPSGPHPMQIIEINGTTGMIGIGLQVISGGGGTKIESLVIGGFSGSGIELDDNGNTIVGNFIGTNSAGTAALANGTGILINSNNNVIGGTSPAALSTNGGNLISGNSGDGILIQGASATGNTIKGNFVGAVLAGTSALANHGNAGVEINGAGSNTIGGTTASALNLISGNTNAGVLITGSGSTMNLVEGNRIGTNTGVTAALGNTNGVVIQSSAATNTVGGTAAGAGNVISGNSNDGVLIAGNATTGNQVQRNFIGVDATGAASLANQGQGVEINGATTNTIGGTTASARNIISGNSGNGILLSGPSNLVEGNFIGTDLTGASAVANGSNGIKITGASNTVGGTTAGAGNLISGNTTGAGVQITGASATGNLVEGNSIGLNQAGSGTLPNTSGVVIQSAASSNTIGGTVAVAANTISGNSGAGVQISDTNTTGNIIEGNKIGTNAAGTSAQPNANGIVIQSGATNNTIGGTAAGAGNFISGNSGTGILIDASGGSGTTGNLVQGNFIGLSAAATPLALPNGKGISIAGGAKNNTIGGTTAAAANLISGNTSGTGVLITDAMTTGNIVEGNFIGTLADGVTTRPNTNGIVIQSGAANNTIGGTSAAAGNVISGNSSNGIQITGSGTSGNLVENNNIGTNKTGTAAVGNGVGVTINGGATGNMIGGGAMSTGNLISGNTGDGVVISGMGTNNNLVQSNSIGTNAAETGALGNVNGVSILAGAANNTVGGATAVAGNLISGNSAAGVLVSGMNTSGNMIEGNFMGTDTSGTVSVANHDGVIIQSMATNNIVGGSMMGAGNLISGNTMTGVTITDSGTTGNQVLDNSIGTNGTGAAALHNQTGVLIQSGASNNTIGSELMGFANLISGNSGDGVQITGTNTSGNKIERNFIGTNQAGSGALANNVGVSIRAGATMNTIGGTAPNSADSNLISGNTTLGVIITGSGTSSNLVQGNFIGTDTGGMIALPNHTGGVAIQGGATGNFVGGTTAGVTNVISGNMGDGVAISGTGTNGNFVQGNFIGTQNDGTTPLANTGNGVSLGAGVAGNTVGGSILTGGGNIIAGNGMAGILVDSNGNTNSSGANLNSNSTNINSGTLQLTSSNAIAATSAVIVNLNGTLDLHNNSDTVASLSDGAAGGGMVLLGNRTLVVGDATSTTFSGTISGANGTLIKAGTGTLTLKGTNTYLSTLINTGTLLVDGVHSGTTATEAVTPGTTLGGKGTGGQGVAGFATVDGTISPGDTGMGVPTTTGVLTVQGALFRSGSTLAIELLNNTLGSGYDQLAGITRSIDLGMGAVTLSVTELSGFSSAVGDMFDIVSNPAGVTGTFIGLPNMATFAVNGTIFRINYTLTDVFLTHVAAGTTTTLATSGSPSTIGLNVTFTATVSVMSPATGTPTGMVNFMDGASPLGSSPLMNGQATFSTTMLSLGDHMITAVYQGTANFAGSTSNVVDQDVVAGQADHFSVTAPSTVQTGAPFSFMVTARDSLNNVASSFTDQVRVTSSDPTFATQTYTFTTGPGGDNGMHTFTITLKSGGPQSVTVTDVVTSSITASANVKVVAKFAKDIVGRASSTGQLWVGLSNGSTAFTTTNWATWSPAVNWTNVVTGDFDGDGRTDIAGRDPSTGVWWVGLSTGSSFSTSSWTVWSTSVTWVDVKVGDFNGDGKMDIAGRDLASGNWWVAQSTGSTFTNNLWDRWSPLVTWVDVQVGDFNGDGKADLVGRVKSAGTWWVGLSTGSAFNTTMWATWSTAITWVDVQVGDFNGDGKSDLTGRALENGQWWTAISDGSSAFASSLWATWGTGATWVDVRVGDFNGDGKADIVGRWLQAGQWWAALSIGTSFNSTAWATWSTGVSWVDVQVGDFNGDGKSDITGRALQTGQWDTGLSNGSTAFTTTVWTTWATGVSWLDVRSGNFG